MISLSKFFHLPPSARLRKLWRFALQQETDLRQGNQVSPGSSELVFFWRQLLIDPKWPELFGQDQILALQLKSLANTCFSPDSEQSAKLRANNDLRHILANLIGKEAAEWDLFAPDSTLSEAIYPPKPDLDQLIADPAQTVRIVFCDDIRSPFNIGSIIRTAEALGFSGVILSPNCPSLDHQRLQRSAMGASQWIHCQSMPFESVLARYRLPVFAIELGGENVGDFAFPKKGIAVLGSEELGVHPEILDICRQSQGVVSIPLPGAKASLNVGVSFGIVAARWPG